MINWKNTSENLIVALISVIVGVFIGYIVAISAAYTIVEQQKSTIELAIKKQTTSITNQVRTEIRKVKATKSAPFTIVVSPDTNSELVVKKTDSIVDSIAPQNTKKKKTSFLKKLFKKHKK